MKLHNLKPKAGSTKSGKRIGRGEGSNKGGTSTRGHKGAKSRSGYKKKRGFEGGQMPLQKRVPKRGFFSRNRVSYAPFNIDRLIEIAEKHSTKDITMEFLITNDYIAKKDLVKVLSSGEATMALNLSVSGCSEKAKLAIEAAGGSITIV